MQPLYKNVADKLRSHILQGKWAPGIVMPTEVELCKQFSASRVTIRKALENLTQEGIISRKAGKGTWVTESEKGQEEWRFKYHSDYPFPKQTSIRILQSDHIAPDHSDSFFGYFGSDEIITRTKVLRNLKDTPLAISEIYMTVPHLEKVLSDFKPDEDVYIFAVLERTTGLRIREVHEIFDAVLAVGEVAKRLKIMESSPLTLITRIFFAEGGEIVQASRVHLRPDVNRFRIIRVK